MLLRRAGTKLVVTPIKIPVMQVRCSCLAPSLPFLLASRFGNFEASIFFEATSFVSRCASAACAYTRASFTELNFLPQNTSLGKLLA